MTTKGIYLVGFSGSGKSTLAQLIGEQLGVPGKTVKSRLFSARRSLARALEVERR